MSKTPSKAPAAKADPDLAAIKRRLAVLEQVIAEGRGRHAQLLRKHTA